MQWLLPWHHICQILYCPVLNLSKPVDYKLWNWSILFLFFSFADNLVVPEWPGQWFAGSYGIEFSLLGKKNGKSDAPFVSPTLDSFLLSWLSPILSRRKQLDRTLGLSEESRPAAWRQKCNLPSIVCRTRTASLVIAYSTLFLTEKAWSAWDFARGSATKFKLRFSQFLLYPNQMR